MKNCRALLIALLLSACVPSTPQYALDPPKAEIKSYGSKPNYSQEAFNSDRYKCLQSSIAQSRRDALSLKPDFNDQMIELETRNQLFSACMEAKGYVQKTDTSYRSRQGISVQDKTALFHAAIIEFNEIESRYKNTNHDYTRAISYGRDQYISALLSKKSVRTEFDADNEFDCLMLMTASYAAQKNLNPAEEIYKILISLGKTFHSSDVTSKQSLSRQSAIRDTLSPNACSDAEDYRTDNHETVSSPGGVFWKSIAKAFKEASAAIPEGEARGAARANNDIVRDRKVYSESECIGPVIMGRCQGSILPQSAYHPTCHGAWINGQRDYPLEVSIDSLGNKSTI